MRSPFVRDATERAAKSFGGGAVTWIFERLIGIEVHSIPLQAAIFGLGCAFTSPVLSLISKNFEFDGWRIRRSRKGTASLIPEVIYQ